MKKFLAVTLSLALPGSTMAGAPPAKTLWQSLDNDQQKSLWHAAEINADGKCAKDAVLDEQGLKLCIDRINAGAAAYAATDPKTLPADQLNGFEIEYAANLPAFKEEKGKAAFANYEKLMVGQKGCAEQGLLQLSRRLLRLDIKTFTETGNSARFVDFVSIGFKDERDCKGAGDLVSAAKKGISDDLHAQFYPLEKMLIEQMPGEKRAPFDAAMLEAALEGPSGAKAFREKSRKDFAQQAAALRDALPAVKPETLSDFKTVDELLTKTDRAVLDTLPAGERKQWKDAIDAANKRIAEGDRTAAVNLAKNIRKVTSGTLSYYSSQKVALSAEERLKKMERALSLISKNPNMSPEDAAAILGDEFDGMKFEDRLVQAPTDPAPPTGNLAGPGTTNPGGKNEPPTPKAEVEIQPDKAVASADKAAETAAKDKSRKFKRSLLGAAYGAVALGFFGMIFGGPIGAIIAAAAGAAIMGGVVHMINNPIK